MPVQTLAPNTITASTNITGAVTDIDEAVGTIYEPNAVIFDGTNDYLRHATALTGVTDGTSFSCALAVRRGATSGTGVFPRIAGAQASAGGSTRWSIGFQPSNHATTPDSFYVEGKNSSNTTICLFYSSIGVTTLNVWTVILASYDLTDVAKRHLYIDDVDRFGTVTAYTAATNVVFSAPFTSIGGNEGGSQKVNGQIADLWIDFNRYVDFSVASNRRLFFASNGKLVNKGTTGNTPFGTAPEIFLSGLTADWHTNKGTGGGFTEIGALTDGTSPGGV